MTLHEAIEKLLKQKGRSMTTTKIADELNRNKWYTKKDRSLIIPYQIHGRTANYSHLFKRQGSMVALIDQSFNEVEKKTNSNKSTTIKAIPNTITSEKTLESNLMNESKFRSAGIIDPDVPAFPGLYCIRIIYPSRLPGIFAHELKRRGHNIIYIGKASRSLYRRLLKQELRARGHGTFFRSIGAVLGYIPPKGQLVHKKNKRNFKFQTEDETQIIQWINENLLINWVEFKGNIPIVESELIAKYKPLLNLDGNTHALEELKLLRAECVRIANDN